jgi:hypothetical protein
MFHFRSHGENDGTKGVAGGTNGSCWSSVAVPPSGC